MQTLLLRFIRSDDGQDVIEYALLTAAIGLAGIATWPLIAAGIGDAYANLDQQTQDVWQVTQSGVGLMTIAEGFCVATVLVACLYDVSTSRIPNVLTFMTAGLAILFHSFAPAGAGWSHALIGLLVGLVVFFPLFALGAMGAGDVKLMAVVGAWIGAIPVLYVALYASLAGGVLALTLALRRKYLRTALANVKLLAGYWWAEGIKPFPALTLESKNSVRLPYALAIAAGLAVTLWRR